MTAVYSVPYSAALSAGMMASTMAVMMAVLSVESTVGSMDEMSAGESVGQKVYWTADGMAAPMVDTTVGK